MRVALDARAIQSRQYGERGVARYTRGLIGGLLAIDAPLCAILLDPNAPPLDPVPPAWQESGLVVAASTTSMRSLPRPFALHRASPFEWDRPVGTGTSGIAAALADRVVATIYDLIPAMMPEIYLQDHAVRRAYESRLTSLKEADLLLAISDDCRNDIIEILGVEPERVATVYAATNQPPSPHDPGDDLETLRAAVPQLVRDPILSITGYEPRKNTLALIDAYAELDLSLRSERQLVLVCSIPPHGRDRWLERARDRGLADDEVIVTGAVTDRVLAALHRRASLEVFPSLAEGFGLPVLEAAHARTPVITSSTTATPEILGLPASTFDPRDIDGMAELMATASTDDALRDRLVAAGDAAAARYTWESVARRTVAAYERLEPRRRRRPPPRHRVALVGPWPPAVSGVATYNERVARALGRVVDLTVLAEHSEWKPDVRSHRLHPIETLGVQIDPESFDRRIHTLGNSLVHRRTLLSALAGPDVVWLHETDLRELHLLTAQLLSDQRGPEFAWSWLNTRVERNGGVGMPDDQSLLDRPDELVSMLPTCSRELASSARLVVVNTDEAQRRLRQECDADLPVLVLPLSVPAREDLGLPRHRADVQRDLVTSFGIVHPSKRPEVILEAVARARDSMPLRLAFVGPSDLEVTGDLAAKAEDLGIADHVTFTGHVDTREYARWLDETAVSVQLRDGNRGEASGAVAEVLGAEIPLVTDMESEAADATVAIPPHSGAAGVAEAILLALDHPGAGHRRPTFDDLADAILREVLGGAAQAHSGR